MLKINPYIILGASHEADIPSLSKLAKRRMRRLRLEGLEDSAEARAVDLALEAVRDPVQQFSLGLFALQLTSAEQEAVWNHPTLSKLSTSITSKDVEDMKNLLAPDAEGYDQSLAAMTLAQAVTALEEAQHGTPDDPADDLEAIEIWRRALTLFKRCTEKPRFWKSRRLYAKSLDDARLGEAEVDRILSSYWHTLLAPAAARAARALQQGHAVVAKAFVSSIRDSGGDESTIDDVLGSVYEGLASEVTHKLEEIKSEYAASNQSSINAVKDVFEHFQSGSLGKKLQLMLDVGDLPGFAEENARDEAAKFCKLMAIRLANNNGQNSGTPDRQRLRILMLCKDIVEYALKIVDSETEKENIQQNINVVRSNIEFLRRQGVRVAPEPAPKPRSTPAKSNSMNRSSTPTKNTVANNPPSNGCMVPIGAVVGLWLVARVLSEVLA